MKGKDGGGENGRGGRLRLPAALPLRPHVAADAFGTTQEGDPLLILVPPLACACRLPQGVHDGAGGPPAAVPVPVSVPVLELVPAGLPCITLSVCKPLCAPPHANNAKRKMQVVVNINAALNGNPTLIQGFHALDEEDQVCFLGGAGGRPAGVVGRSAAAVAFAVD